MVSALEIDHPYPPTKIMWSPASLGSRVELLATTADFLRLWKISDSSIELHSRFTEVCDRIWSCVLVVWGFL